MGAWGLGIFENDSALDWVYELTSTSGSFVLEQTLKAIINGDEYIEVDEGSAGLAAIEVINILKGTSPSDPPESVVVWVDENRSINTKSLVPMANQALQKVSNVHNSEVAQLWLEGDHDWNGLITDISTRLNS